jgi:hypothetical protein
VCLGGAGTRKRTWLDLLDDLAFLVGERALATSLLERQSMSRSSSGGGGSGSTGATGRGSHSRGRKTKFGETKRGRRGGNWWRGSRRA